MRRQKDVCFVTKNTKFALSTKYNVKKLTKENILWNSNHAFTIPHYRTPLF